MNVKEDEEDEDMKSAGGKDNNMEEEEMKDEKEDADEDVIEEYEIMEENEEMKADMPKKKKNKIKFATSNMVETETLEEQAEVVDTKAVVAESEVEVDTKKPKLGFIGEIFKAIVKHNTWRSA